MDTLKFCLEKYGRLYPDVAQAIETAVPIDLPPIDFSPYKGTADLGDVQDVLIYGVGKGELYTVLKKWLYRRIDRVLIFIEEDIGVLRALFETELGKTILCDDRVEILFHYKSNPLLLHNRLMWQGLSRKRIVLGDPRVCPEKLDDLNDVLNYDSDKMLWVGKDFQSFGLAYYLNYFTNLKELPHCYDGTAFFGKAKKVPAIIVGAGPSLDKNGHLLKKLKKKALIIAGGSSLPAIKQFKLTPHFGGGIDPNIWQCERLKSYGPIRFPFLFFSRLSAPALRMIEGERIYLPGTSGYPTENWINEQLGIQKSPFQEGYSITHMMTEVAIQFECDPIIYVGVDLSYPNNVHYAKGVTQPTEFPEDIIQAKDIHGNPITSRWMWLKESLWLSEYAKQHPNTTFINATEGGIGFEGIPNESLAQIEKRLKKPFDFDKTFKTHKLKVTKDQINKVVQELYESLLNLETLLKEMHESYSKIDITALNPDNLVLPEDIEWMKKLENELAFKVMLSIFNTYCFQLIAGSHTVYLVARDGMNIKLARQMISLHLQRIRYLQEVTAGEIKLLERVFGF